MTLVMGACMGGRFAIMTSDFREAVATYNTATKRLEINHEESALVAHRKVIKADRLTEFVLIGSAGFTDLTEYLKDAIKREVKPDYDLDDCKRVLETVVQRERENKDGPQDVLEFIHHEISASLTLTGFFRDGSAGFIKYDTGEDVNIREGKLDPTDNGYLTDILSPVEEYSKRHAELLEVPEIASFNNEEMSVEEVTDFFLESTISRLLTIHGLIAYNHRVEVSPDLEVHILVVKDGGYVEYDLRRYDLSDQFAKLDKLKASS